MPRTFLSALILVAACPAWLAAQLDDPVPGGIPAGSLVLQLEDWITMPETSSKPPRTRLSVFRALPGGRIFVNDLRGPLYLIADGRASVFLDMTRLFPKFITSPGLGTGFHSFDFHPEFATNGKFYTTHTETWDANGSVVDLKGPAPLTSAGLQAVLTEWTVSDRTATVFDGTRRELFRVFINGTAHGMQEIRFNPTASPGDPDYGLLYVCLGEGGSFQMGLAGNLRRPDSPLGSILRIDPLGTNAPNGRYGIPRDNPRADATDPSVVKEVFAFGFRNPHRIEWDPAGDHLFYTGDIGERNIEEIDILVAGGDYGYPEREGTFVLRPDEPENRSKIYPLPANDAKFGYRYPAVQFDHDEGAAIVIGPVYRGSRFPALQGTLLFGTIDTGRIFYLDVADVEPGSQAPFREARVEMNGTVGKLTSFVGQTRADLRWGVDQAGELYVITRMDGRIRKVAGVRFDETASSQPAPPRGFAR